MRRPIPRHTTIISVAVGGVMLLATLHGEAGAQPSPGDPASQDGGAESADAGTGDAIPSSPPAPPPPEQAGRETEPGADRATGIQGRIVSRKTGEPLIAAPVLLLGEDGRTRAFVTDQGGGYVAHVPPGTYTVRSYSDLFHGARLDKVRVTRGKLNQVNLVLDPVDVEEEVVVQEIEIPYRADTTTAAAQDQLRKESSGIGEGMGAQQMSQQGASDAAGAAKRVVGVTVDRNQLVVRGLGGRYVKVYLNGLPVPNTDPDYPSVDLDLFPTNVIDSLNISKTFLPDIPGDFAGGALDITTVSFPREFILEVGVSSGVNSESTFRERLSYQGGEYDFLGFDDGTRKLPQAIEGKRLRRDRNGAFPTAQAVEQVAEQFPNVWQYRRSSSAPDLGVDFTIGDAIKLGGKKRVGYLAALAYDNGNERQTGFSRPRPQIGATGQLELGDELQTETGSEEVQLAAIGTASLDLGLDHSLTALTMYNRAVEDETKYQVGIKNEVDSTARYQKWQLRYLARTMFLNQLLGDHRNLLGTRARLRWSGFWALGARDEPDQRTIEYGVNGGVQDRWRPTADRLYSEMTQTDVGGTLGLRFPLWREAWLSVGGRAGRSDRDFQNRRFQLLELATASDPLAFQQGPEAIFSKEGLGTLSQMVEFTRPVDSYIAHQTMYAAFAMLETPILGPLSLAGGARLEVSSQEVASQSPFPGETSAEDLAKNRSDRSDANILPGAALKYGITDSMILRAAYGMTLSRPQVRELAPYDYYDFLRDRIIVGNPALKTATIHNADLRWEWFFGEGQIAAVSGFFKKFADPIELQIINPMKYDSQYVNAQGATSFGAEMELRSGLAGIATALRRFSLGGNLSLIESRVELPPELSGAVRSQRPLSGQAPYVINLSLRFSDPDTAVSAGFVYNVVGPKIVDVGTRQGDFILPDVRERSFHSLDLVGSWGITKHLKLKIKGRNLLFQKKTLTQGNLTVQELSPGVSGSLGLAYTR